MDAHFSATREDLYHVQMDMKHVQAVQVSHADRILRLERRQADDAALKSVWTSPFPGILNGTPQQGPVHTPAAEVFDDFDDEHTQNLLGSLHIDTEDEPIRRGTSRANSVRFDVSATHGSNWAQNSRSSGEFGPVRPNSGFGGHPMERALSHKSDGRHSSAGHSVHSVLSTSGRTSSLGLNSHFSIGAQDDSCLFDAPEPPPGLFVLGSVPSIIRCWLSEDFSHSALLYAVVCTGSQKSRLDLSLIKELGLLERIQKDAGGICSITLPVYLPEAVITQPASGASNSPPQLPLITVPFEVIGIDRQGGFDAKKSIRTFLGNDVLRAHSADLLLSQNLMTLYGDDRNRLSIPFVRPEDDSVFKNLCTINIVPNKVSLKGTAVPFTPGDKEVKDSLTSGLINGAASLPAKGESQPGRLSAMPQRDDVHDGRSSDQPVTNYSREEAQSTILAPLSDNENRQVQPNLDSSANEPALEDTKLKAKEIMPSTNSASENRGLVGGIWGSWRSGGSSGNDGELPRDNVSTSGYNKPGKGIRSMKVLKPSKIATQNGSVGAGIRAEEGPHASTRSPSDDTQQRRKSHVGFEENSSSRWEQRKPQTDEKAHKNVRSVAVPRSNPVGGASAFAWMKSGNARADITNTQ